MFISCMPPRLLGGFFFIFPPRFFRIFLTREVLKFLFVNGIFPLEFFNRKFSCYCLISHRGFRHPSFFIFLFFQNFFKLFIRNLPGRLPGRFPNAWCYHCHRPGHWICTCFTYFKYGMVFPQEPAQLRVHHAIRFFNAHYRSYRGLDHLVRYERNFLRIHWIKFFLSWIARREIVEALELLLFGH